MDRYLEYLIKDYIRKDSSVGDGSEFTDERCEKVDVGVVGESKCRNSLHPMYII